MQLAKLLEEWFNVETDIDIKNLQTDSRKIKKGDAFLAIKGHEVDGRLYIDDALSRGAKAVIYEPNGIDYQDKTIFFPLKNLSVNIPKIVAKFYDFPSKLLTVIGITGTNGKTTVAWQLSQAYKLLGKKTAYIGTLGAGDPNGQLRMLTNTTPGPLELQKLLYKFSKEGFKNVAMEVSSHALHQDRVNEVSFKQAIFTNLSHEHLDYHHNMKAYALCKAKLFSMPNLKYAILNKDETAASLMHNQCGEDCKTIYYGINMEADVRVLDYTTNLGGSIVNIYVNGKIYNYKIKTIGLFNIYNSLAVFTSLMAENIPLSDILEVMPKLKAAPGRMEVMRKNPYIIVDYAHTPDALINILKTLATLKKGRIFVLFGCGGDRDKDKRPIMGNIASMYADVIFITNDNPRNEDPAEIIKEIKKGIFNNVQVYTIPDREKAISKAISFLNKDDILLIAGKGHETYQLIGDKKLDFSDQEIVKSLTIS